MALRHAELIGIFDRTTDRWDVGEVDLWVDAMAQQVESESH